VKRNKLVSHTKCSTDHQCQ